MRLTPTEPEIAEGGGFTPENDIFEYGRFAERLTNLVRFFDEPLVIALDSPWGSGKSVFVKQWASLLRQQGAPVILFDAFENDYYEDGFLALSAEIYDAAKKTLGGNSSAARKYLGKAKKAGKILAPIALNVAARAGTAGILSIDDIGEGGAAVKEAIRVAGNESAKAVEKAISERLRKASDERAAFAAFREVLSKTAGAMAERVNDEGKQFPLVFIIDELDRCRPPFALSVIERIKHLFSVPGVCFVLVMHLPQLERAVEGAYGANFDAHAYLEKFYHLRMVLPDRRNEPGRRLDVYLDYLWDALGIEFPEVRLGQLVHRDLAALAKAYDFSLRRLERVMTHIALVAAAAGARRALFAPVVAGLSVMRQTHQDLYKTARDGRLTWPDARAFLQPFEGGGVQAAWSLEWWRFATGEELDEKDVADFQRALAQFDLHEPYDIISVTIGHLDGLPRI